MIQQILPPPSPLPLWMQPFPLDIKVSLAQRTWAPGTASQGQAPAVRGLACFQPSFGTQYLTAGLAQPLWPDPKGGPWSRPVEARARGRG